jgi:predicted dehydrogenase
VVACYAPTPRRRDKLADEFGIRAYADMEEMIMREKPDLVHLVTWPDNRVELMTFVSRLGVPGCTVEKPIATGVSDWKELCKLEETCRTKFAICHQFRWHPVLVRCRKVIQSGKLGNLKFLDVSAGMNICDQGTHILNYGMSLNGDSPVASVFGAASGGLQMGTGHPGPDGTMGYLTFENGVRALWSNGPNAPRCGNPEASWQHVRVAAYLERGSVEWEEFGTWTVVSTDGEESGDFGGMDTWMENNIKAQAAFHRSMFDWLEDDHKIPGTNLKQSLHEWRVVLALYASTLSRKPVELARFNPPNDLMQMLLKVL